MKKIEVKTVCGEISTIYVSQDVEEITIDGEIYQKNIVDDERLETEDCISLVEFLKIMLKKTEEDDYESWGVDYKVIRDPDDETNYLMTVDFSGEDLPKEIFKL